MCFGQQQVPEGFFYVERVVIGFFTNEVSSDATEICFPDIQNNGCYDGQDGHYR
jgi:hypothetical protein